VACYAFLVRLFHPLSSASFLALYRARLRFFGAAGRTDEGETRRRAEKIGSSTFSVGSGQLESELTGDQVNQDAHPNCRTGSRGPPIPQRGTRMEAVERAVEARDPQFQHVREARRLPAHPGALEKM